MCRYPSKVQKYEAICWGQLSNFLHSVSSSQETEKHSRSLKQTKITSKKHDRICPARKKGKIGQSFIFGDDELIYEVRKQVRKRECFHEVLQCQKLTKKKVIWGSTLHSY
jgi:hypothetical protein